LINASGPAAIAVCRGVSGRLGDGDAKSRRGTLAMTYIKWRDADGYETGCRECLDLSSFAADLCKALDGKPISTNDRDGYATFELADGCKLSLSNSWRSNEVDKVTVHIDPPDELDRLRGYDLSAECRLPASVTVSAKLPLDQIVADVKDRLITPAQTPLANLREFSRQLERDGRPLEMIGTAYAAQFPELEITVPELPTIAAASVGAPRFTCWAISIRTVASRSNGWSSLARSLSA
jgi:hypothetical protein